MGKFIYCLSALLFSLLLLPGCKKDTPKDVANTWLNCFWHLDFDGAENVSTDQTQNLLRTFEKLASVKGDSLKQKSKDITIAIKSVRDSEGTATVVYTTSDNPRKMQLLNLVQVDGKWLVQFSKSDQMISGYGATSDDHAQDTDSTQGGAIIEGGVPDPK